MPAPYFFGYGSLVNRATHSYPDASPAQLDGWQRVWRHTDWHATAFLSVEPAKDTQIDGLIAHVPNSDWTALDVREGGYQRIPSKGAVRHSANLDIDIAHYVVAGDWQGDQPAPRPILLSYIDVVIQGFLQEFGQSGAARFFTTTKGWETPILNDRPAPRYPRHQTLTKDETAFVDTHLTALNAWIVHKL
ncbi:MAG: gamma-glutamylcyclotransferase [Rhodobacteraceae bacterium]|nr:gamma-glutamylcyclotransferase [Paracoccaceae bacterium]